MVAMAQVVHFPHPGGEHAPRGEGMDWNTRPGHKRKYLVAPGRTATITGAVSPEQTLLFWGEFEAPSRVVHRWTPAGDLPTVVHDPYWIRPGPDGPRQNTDPWVFGPHFLYSNCKQVTHKGTPTGLQQLDPGSLILFGSTRDGRFVLDTVFVVADIECRWVPVNQPSIGGPAFKECTVRSLSADNRHAGTTFTLYRGATPDDPVGGMFSWAPCQPMVDETWPRFRRPTITLRSVVNPASKQSPSGAKIRRPIGEIRQMWQRVAEQTEAQGLNLGFGFGTPPRKPVQHDRSQGRSAGSRSTRDGRRAAC